MFIDARQLENRSSIRTTVCIIGGGVAGITLALELEKRGVPCCLVESGGFRGDEATRDLYRGENVGLPYVYADGCRSRFLGGSSNCWGGWCRPLDEHDFLKRDWVPNSGWPFTRAELQPYYELSHQILRLGPNRFDTAFWIDAIHHPDVRRITFANKDIEDGVSQFSPPVRFGKHYRDTLAKAKHATVYLYANVVDIQTDGTSTVQRVSVMTLTGRTHTISARVFVLATGGIENARLLLTSNKHRPEGLGNHNDVVGRFFMDHPRLYSSKITFSKAWSRNMLYDTKFHYHNKAVGAHGTCIAAQFGLTPQLRSAERLLNARVCFSSFFLGEHSQAAKALVRCKDRLLLNRQHDSTLGADLLTLLTHPIAATTFVAGRFFGPWAPVTHAKFQVIVEPVPNPESRVTLSESKDELGMNRVKVDWRLDDLVKRTIDRTVAIIAEDLNRSGVANVVLDPSIVEHGWPSDLEKEGCWHHMGTTRMHDSPKLGVVDRNCQVYGTTNLFIAGSSVFPTGGSNFPTITIVALALRLCDHLDRLLRPPVI